MLNWERLRVLAAVAEHGSISAAAAALHVTGPAVTQQVRKLEREVGVPLVEKNGRGIRLTSAGHVAADGAGSVARTVATVEEQLATVAGRVVGPLRIGALNSCVGPLVAPTLRLLAQRHPDLTPTARTGEAIDLLPELVTRNLDVLLVESWSTLPARTPPRLRVHPLVTHDIVLAIGADHRFAGLGSVRLDKLGDEPWTACRAGTDNHEAQVQALRRHGVEPDVRYVVDDFLTQMTLVAAGLAATLVPREAVEAAPDVRLIPITPPITRTIGVAVRQGDCRPAVAAFRSAVGEVARGGAAHAPAAVARRHIPGSPC